MQSQAKPSKVAAPAKSKVSRCHRPGGYQKAWDASKRLPVRGLWVRNGSFYARLSVEDPNTGRKQVRRVRLTQATTLAQARAELRRLQTRRETNDLGVLRRTPKFSAFAKAYLNYYETVKDAKRPKTLQTEKGHLKRWVEHLGDTRLDRITPAMIHAFIAMRQAEGCSGRTVNLGVTVLRNCLKRAIQDGWLQRLPTETIRPLKWNTKKKRLFTLAEIEAICEEAFRPQFVQGRLATEEEQRQQLGRPLKNAQQFADYVRLMAFSGARMAETLRLKWSDVDQHHKQLTIGADGLTKNREARVVDFNPKLHAHLKEMETRRAPDSQWLFPSPQRGDRDLVAKTFRESLLLARTAAKQPGFGFHACRHCFVSFCVMSGIDFMTIARWVGHRDGGVLIGKVYGHLADTHRKRMAQKVSFDAANPEPTAT